MAAKEYLMRKKNRQIRVESLKQKEAYLKDGYDVIDPKTGEVVEPATGGKTYTAKQYNDLREKYEKAKSGKKADEVKKINDENAALKAENIKLTKSNEDLTKEVESLKAKVEGLKKAE